jgi:hypothetical protein
VQSLAAALAADQPPITAISTSDVTAFRAALNPIISSLSSKAQMADQQVKTLVKDKKVAKGLAGCGSVFALGNSAGASTPGTAPSAGAGRSAPPGGTSGGAAGGGGAPAGGPAGGVPAS